MRITDEWLQRHIATDPYDELEAGNPFGKAIVAKEQAMTAMRAKMTITKIERHAASEVLSFTAVAAKSYPADGSDENNTYAKFSPAGMLSLTVANPALLGRFNPGESYYLDFTKADA